MIDWKSEPLEFQRKYQFDNVRLMANQMIDDGCIVTFYSANDYKWSFTFSGVTYRHDRDGDFDGFVGAYIRWVNRNEKQASQVNN